MRPGNRSTRKQSNLPVAETVEDYRQGLVESLFTSLLNARFSELVQEADPPFLGGGASDGGFTRDTGTYSLGAAVEEGGVERGFEALATEAARLLLGALAVVVSQPTPDARRAMARGAHFAGRAIDVTKTTTPHALANALEQAA